MSLNCLGLSSKDINHQAELASSWLLRRRRNKHAHAVRVWVGRLLCFCCRQMLACPLWLGAGLRSMGDSNFYQRVLRGALNKLLQGKGAARRPVSHARAPASLMAAGSKGLHALAREVNRWLRHQGHPRRLLPPAQAEPGNSTPPAPAPVGRLLSRRVPGRRAARWPGQGASPPWRGGGGRPRPWCSTPS
jgi:hypothetical protein